jgi:endonuclease/exonuclease/phosphatase family metal-dependent hydrolase
MRTVLAVLTALALVGCKVDGFSDAGVAHDGAPVLDARPGVVVDARPLATNDAAVANPDVVPPVGTEATLDVACWNIENFPKAQNSVKAFADLVASLELDLVAVEEVNDPLAFQAVLDRLPGWSGVLGSGNNNAGGEIPAQQLGFLWKTAKVSVTDAHAIFTNDSSPFPRPAFQATVTSEGQSFTMIAVHLKAGVESADQARRAAAHLKLADYIDDLTGGTLLCGDMNQEIYGTPDAGAGSVYDPYLADATTFRLLSGPLDASGVITFLDFDNMLDHMIGTAGLDGLRDGEMPFIPPLHEQYSPYHSVLTDHLPIVLQLHP